MQRDATPIDKIRIEENKEDIKNPPTPQGGIGGEKIGASCSHESVKGKRPTGNSLPELRALMRGYTSSPPLLDALEDFRLMRERIRKPMTGRALQLLLGELDKLSGNREAVKIAILHQSILNSWQGVFPLKDSSISRASHVRPMSLAQENFQTAMSVIAEMERENCRAS